MSIPDLDKAVTIDYTNYLGERRKRKMIPLQLWYGVSAYHKGPQWFLHGFDVEKEDERDYALAQIHGTEKV